MSAGFVVGGALVGRRHGYVALIQQHCGLRGRWRCSVGDTQRVTGNGKSTRRENSRGYGMQVNQDLASSPAMEEETELGQDVPAYATVLEARNVVASDKDVTGATLEKRPTTSASGGPGPEDDRRHEFYANVGSVTRTLREDYPQLLEKDPDLTMFTENILLRDQFNFSGICVQGKHAYKYFFWGLRMRSKVFFRDAVIRLQNVFYDQQDGIYVRWQLCGVKRLSGWVSDEIATEDGLSLYKLNDQGFVCEHIVVRVIPPKQRAFSSMLTWFQLLARPPVPAGASQCETEVPFDSDNAKMESALSDIDQTGGH